MERQKPPVFASSQNHLNQRLVANIEEFFFRQLNCPLNRRHQSAL
jgi:hypothetical protein